MNKLAITFFSLLLFSVAAFSQLTDSVAFVQLQKEVRQLQHRLKEQKNFFSEQIMAANQGIGDLQTSVQSLQAAQAQIVDSLGIQIVTTQTNAEKEIEGVQKSISQNRLYWIVALVVIALLSIALFLFLHKRQKKDKTALVLQLDQTKEDFVAQLSQTKESIDERLVEEFAKIVESLDVLSRWDQSSTIQTASANPDHSLVLKVASEINLIERNIKLMDAETKGLKHLRRSVEKLKNNLAANNYEMPDLLGSPLHEGMKVIVINSIPDETLEKGSEIITKILIPQVNYNGVMIQAAQIEVSVGY